jgi:glycosyltransferase involved in cell wall biosynthesis
MRKIKLGIDAKWYFYGPPSGSVVVQNIVNEIFNLNDNDFEYYLIVGKQYASKAISLFGNKFKIIKVRDKPNSISNLFLIPHAIKKYDLDVVLFQNFISVGKADYIKIAYIHDFLFLDYPQYYSKRELLYYKPMKWLAKKADVIITISNTEKNRMLKHKINSSEKIFVVHHGISEEFKKRDEYKSSEIETVRKRYQLPDKYFLYVGRINIRKNLLNLIKALNFLEDKEIKLVIVGKSEFKNIDMSSYIKKENLTDRIIFTGEVSQQDLHIIFALSYIFCFPSYAEGFGLPPVEAMRCGIPAIVSNRTSLPEVCGDAGIYINPDDPVNIAAKINLLLADKNYYDLKVQASIEQAYKYTWPQTAKNILSIIKSIIYAA